jgi:hypothetical protein
MVEAPLAVSILEAVSARQVGLLFLSSRVLPTLERPYQVRLASRFTLVTVLILKEGASDEELAASAASHALPSSLPIYRENQAREESGDFAIERTA